MYSKLLGKVDKEGGKLTDLEGERLRKNQRNEVGREGGRLREMKQEGERDKEGEKEREKLSFPLRFKEKICGNRLCKGIGTYF